jgi:hypothetical protein
MCYSVSAVDCAQWTAAPHLNSAQSRSIDSLIDEGVLTVATPGMLVVANKLTKEPVNN